MVKLSEVKVGKEFVNMVKGITRPQITNYGNASGDRNPIHMDDKFAAERGGLKGVIAHGLLWFGFIGRFLTELADKGKVLKWGGQFRGTVRPGDDVETHVKVTKIEGKKVSVEINQYSITPFKIEKGGKIVKKYEAEEKGWMDDKDPKEGNMKTKEVPEGTLTYRYRLSCPGTAVLELVN